MGEVLNDSVMLKTELGRFGQKVKILNNLHNITFFDLEYQNNLWEVLNNSMMHKMELGRFGQKNQNFAYLG